MENFDLINDLQKRSQQSEPENSSNIEYQDYTVKVLGENVLVSVPVRESENFEQVIAETPLITKVKLKTILREHRGFIQVNKNKHKGK